MTEWLHFTLLLVTIRTKPTSFSGLLAPESRTESPGVAAPWGCMHSWDTGQVDKIVEVCSSSSTAAVSHNRLSWVIQLKSVCSGFEVSLNTCYPFELSTLDVGYLHGCSAGKAVMSPATPRVGEFSHFKPPHSSDMELPVEPEGAQSSQIIWNKSLLQPQSVGWKGNIPANSYLIYS